MAKAAGKSGPEEAPIQDALEIKSSMKSDIR